jgi:hypothetical protein
MCGLEDKENERRIADCSVRKLSRIVQDAYPFQIYPCSFEINCGLMQSGEIYELTKLLF